MVWNITLQHHHRRRRLGIADPVARRHGGCGAAWRRPTEAESGRRPSRSEHAIQCRGKHVVVVADRAS